MLPTTWQAAFGAVALFLLAQPAAATHSHRHVHKRIGRRHGHGHTSELLSAPQSMDKRATCSLPGHPDLVRVPGADNNGFAMSPDQSCDSGKYCPFACVPGKVMAQWEPNSTYTYPQSMVSDMPDPGPVARASCGSRDADWRRTEVYIVTVEPPRSLSLTLPTVWMVRVPSAR